MVVNSILSRDSATVFMKQRSFSNFAQVEGLEGVTVGHNSTGADDSCDWFVTFTDTPGNVDQVYKEKVLRT